MNNGDASEVLVDCRWYRGSMPCRPHKQDGRRCGGCSAYEPVGTRVLIVKLGALGDVLRTTALLPSIRASYPGAHVTWLTSEAARSLLAGNPLIDRVITIEGHYLEVLLTERFDIGFSLDNEPLAASAGRLARCAAMRGFVVNDSGAVVPASGSAVTWWRMGLDDGLKRQNRRTWFHLMSELCEMPLTRSRPQIQIPAPLDADMQQRLSAWRGSGAYPLIGVNTGGGGRWAHKKWTFSGYSSFIRELRTARSDCRIVLLGGPDESLLNCEIVDQVGELVIDGGCHDDVHRFAALVKGLDVLVTSDSLGLHVATAVGTAAVALVGPTSPWELDVFGAGEILAAPTECVACYRIRCDKPVACMDRIDVGTVVGATLRQLESPSRRRMSEPLSMVE